MMGGCAHMWQLSGWSVTSVLEMDLDSALRDARLWPVYLLNDLAPDRLDGVLAELEARGLGDNVVAARAANVLMLLRRYDDALAVTALHEDGLAYAQQMLTLAQLGTDEARAQILAGRRMAADGPLTQVPCGLEAQMRLEYALGAAYNRVQDRALCERHYERALMLGQALDADSMVIAIEGSRLLRDMTGGEECLNQLQCLLAKVRAQGAARNRSLESYMIGRLVAAHALRFDYASVERVAQEFEVDAPDAWMAAAARTCRSCGVSAPPPLDGAPRHPLMLLAHALYHVRCGQTHVRQLDWTEAGGSFARVLDLEPVDDEHWPGVSVSLLVLRALAHLGLGDLRAATAELRTLQDRLEGARPHTAVIVAATALEVQAHGGARIPGLSGREALTLIETGLRDVPPQVRGALSLMVTEFAPHAAAYAAERVAAPALTAALGSRVLRVDEQAATLRGADLRGYPTSAEAYDTLAQIIRTRGENGPRGNTTAQHRRRHREALFNASDPPIAYAWRVRVLRDLGG